MKRGGPHACRLERARASVVHAAPGHVWEEIMPTKKNRLKESKGFSIGHANPFLIGKQPQFHKQNAKLVMVIAHCHWNLGTFQGWEKVLIQHWSRV